MGTGRKRGHSGGTSLNFKMVGNPQPTSAKENTIWLNTDTPINGYQFATEQPENAQPGEVWISIGTDSQVAFNALKKNTIMVYPLSAKQYVNGAWADVEANSWQDGKWVEWISFLYDRGKIGLGGIPSLIYTDNAERGKLTLNDGYIALELRGNAYVRGGFPDAVNFSAYSTMKATVKAPSWWSTATQFRFGVDSGQNTASAHAAQAINGYTAGTEYTIMLDISSYNETARPWFELANLTGNGEENTLYVLAIDLE